MFSFKNIGNHAKHWFIRCCSWTVCRESNFIEITLEYGCSPVNLLHISRTPFPGWLLLDALNSLRYLEYSLNIFVGCTLWKKQPVIICQPCRVINIQNKSWYSEIHFSEKASVQVAWCSLTHEFHSGIKCDSLLRFYPCICIRSFHCVCWRNYLVCSHTWFLMKRTW